MSQSTDNAVTAGSENSPGLYVAVKFQQETIDNIVEFQLKNNIPNPVPPEDLHSTIVYSRVNIEWTPVSNINLRVNTDTSVLETWDTRSGSSCLVWHYYSPFQHQRFKEAMSHGATYDFPEYKCHITLSYDCGDITADSINKPDFPILLDREYLEVLDNPNNDSSGPSNVE
jgi:hypothetical protein